jgi:hypothetical protein
VGTNSSSFTTPVLSSTASYWVRISNALATVDSALATITVSSPITIGSQPSSSTVVSGSRLILSVEATGTASLAYQWYQGLLGDTSQPVGSNLSYYLTPVLNASTSYWVRIRSADGSTSADSALASVEVLSPPSITTQPTSTGVLSGGTRTLTVQAASSQPLVYQWYQGNAGTTSIPVGSNSPSFTTPALSSARSYWVRIGNDHGSIDSATATVSIATLPGISQQPFSSEIATGSTASLSVVATGTAPFTYQWYQGSLGNTSLPVGSNAPSYTTPALSTTSSYWVRVSNVVGSIDSSVSTITVTLPPSIITQPSSTSIVTGGRGILTVSANGGAPLQYQWYQGAAGNTALPVGSNSSSFSTPILTATTSYWVRVTNNVGNVNSSAATITVWTPPAITTHPASLGITENTTTTLTVAATGFAPMTYQWYQGTVGNTTSPVGGNSASFTTPTLSTATSYWVRITNDLGTVDSALATVFILPTITTQPISQTIANGGTATLSVTASGSSPFNYQWYRGAEGVTSSPVGSNSPNFTTPALSTTTSYWVRVSNSVGNINSQAATLSVLPTITTQPISQTIAHGGTATLSVTASGTNPFTYQWYQGTAGNAATPVGSDSPSFTTPALSTTSSYWVRVSNSVGNINSQAATLSILPSITTQPSSQTIAHGGTATLSVTASGSSPFTYQWYQGNVGSMSNPVGNNSPNFTTPALITATSYWVRVSNSGGTTDSIAATLGLVTVPANFAYIPAGNFVMGRTSGDTDADAPPVTVNVSAFFMGKYEVTKALWDEVRTWAVANGYTDLATGAGKASNHPVHSISWFDTIKWCNARSQKEGLSPVYSLSGSVGSEEPTADWSANGY